MILNKDNQFYQRDWHRICDIGVTMTMKLPLIKCMLFFEYSAISVVK